MARGQWSEIRGQGTALIVFCVLSGVEALAAQPLTPDPRPLTTSVVMLGTGNPNPDPDRSGPAVAIVVNGAAYLVAPEALRAAGAEVIEVAEHPLVALEGVGTAGVLGRAWDTLRLWLK